MEDGEMEDWNDEISSMVVELKPTAVAPTLIGRWKRIVQGNGKVGKDVFVGVSYSRTDTSAVDVGYSLSIGFSTEGGFMGEGGKASVSTTLSSSYSKSVAEAITKSDTHVIHFTCPGVDGSSLTSLH